MENELQGLEKHLEYISGMSLKNKANHRRKVRLTITQFFSSFPFYRGGDAKNV